MSQRTITFYREPKPDNFRWVKALATLAEGVFGDVADCVRADSHDANRTLSRATPRQCGFSRDGASSAFLVHVSAPPDRQAVATVEFKLKDFDRIEATTTFTGGKANPPCGHGPADAAARRAESDSSRGRTARAVAIQQARARAVDLSKEPPGANQTDGRVRIELSKGTTTTNCAPLKRNQR